MQTKMTTIEQTPMAWTMIENGVRIHYVALKGNDARRVTETDWWVFLHKHDLTWCSEAQIYAQNEEG